MEQVKSVPIGEWRVLCYMSMGDGQKALTIGLLSGPRACPFYLNGERTPDERTA